MIPKAKDAAIDSDRWKARLERDKYTSSRRDVLKAITEAIKQGKRQVYLYDSRGNNITIHPKLRQELLSLGYTISPERDCCKLSW